MSFSPETHCSKPACKGEPLILLKATDEMLDSSDGFKELERIASVLGTTVGDVTIGLCPVCSVTYYISL